MMRSLLVLAWLGTVAPLVGAAEIRVYPPEVPLTGKTATQALFVGKFEAGQIIGDVTAIATFTTSNPKVVSVDAQGVVRAVGDGEAMIAIRNGEAQTMTKVSVRGVNAPFAWNFRNHVQAVLTRSGCNSGACHGALAGKGGLKLSLRGYDPATDHFVITRQALGRRIDGTDPAQSLLLTKGTRTIPHGGGTRLDAESADYSILLQWIEAGAPGPSDNDPTLNKLEVFPPRAMLQPNDKLRIIVRAWYSDGRAEDVTNWVKFSSSEEQVTTISEDGQATVMGHGEAAIAVVFGNRVATMTISSPFPNRIAPTVFTAAPRHNFIDEHVLNKLQQLHLPPSPNCTDAEFIRRVYLDAAGILPTPDEVVKFLADNDPQKRAKLIDAVLERPEFVDYWSYKWSDLLLVSTRKLPQPAMWAFYRAVRQSVADNKPWDQFARDILTASGSSLERGEGNYFVLHKDVADLTESTAVTFLGMSITCARCHNHPLEKWTQDQYWSMANLFSRVAMKNGDRTGEVLVQSANIGDVLHARRNSAMKPTPLDGKPLNDEAHPDRRAYFADWLTAANNPFFAKATVNRVWRNYLGRGLVEAEDDLRDTNPATNPELLDALAADFIKNGFDMKRLMRLIMNSATYQRSSKPLPENAADDRFYSRYLVKRLSAEVVLDAYAQVTGVPTPFDKVITGVEGGTAPTGSFPLGTRALQLPDTRIASAFLDAFGRPNREQTCSCERQDDSSVGQALHLNNGQTLNDKLRSKDSRIEQWVKEGISDRDVVKRLFMAALSREPTEAEQQRFAPVLADAPANERRQVLEDLFWAVLTGREFLFNR